MHLKLWRGPDYRSKGHFPKGLPRVWEFNIIGEHAQLRLLLPRFGFCLWIDRARTRNAPQQIVRHNYPAVG